MSISSHKKLFFTNIPRIFQVKIGKIVLQIFRPKRYKISVDTAYNIQYRIQNTEIQDN